MLSEIPKLDVSLMRKLLPPGVATAEVRSELSSIPTIFPSEAMMLGNCVPSRHREFATVRLCARVAMAELGLAPYAILPDARGAPLWPEGVIGSMTHCLDYCAAAVSLDKRIRAIGIDAEIDEPLPEIIIGMIASMEEQSYLKDLQCSQPRINWDRLLFSAKESIFKAWYPLHGIELEFENAQLYFSKMNRSFTYKLLGLSGRHESLNGVTCAGNWNSHRGILATSVLL